MEVNTLEGNKKGILVHGFVEVNTLEGEALALVILFIQVLKALSFKDTCYVTSHSIRTNICLHRMCAETWLHGLLF